MTTDIKSRLITILMVMAATLTLSGKVFAGPARAVVTPRLRYVLGNRNRVLAEEAHTVRKLLGFV